MALTEMVLMDRLTKYLGLIAIAATLIAGAERPGLAHTPQFLISYLGVSGPLQLDSLQNTSPVVAQTDEQQVEAGRFLEQGIEQYRRSQYREAVRSWQRALTLYREIGDRPGEANTLNNIGEVNRFLGNYPAALDYFQQSLAIVRDLGDRAAESVILNNIGSMNQLLGNYPMALDYYQQSLVITRGLSDRAGETRTLNNIGFVNQFLGNYPIALDYYQQSLIIARQIEDRAGEAVILNNIGEVNQALGNYSAALDDYQQSLLIARNIGDRAREAFILNNIGEANRLVGNYATALDYYQQSLLIFRDIGVRAGEAQTLNNTGNVNVLLGDYPVALDYFQQSLLISQDIGDLAGEARTLNNIGEINRLLGDYPVALDYFQQSLLIFRDIGNHAAEATTFQNIGNVNALSGNYPAALDDYQQSLMVSQGIGDRATEAQTLNNIGEVQETLGDYPVALDYYQQSLLISQDIGDRATEAQTLSNVGALLANTNRFTEAEITLRQAIETFESLRSDLTDAQLISIADTQASAYATLEQTLIAQDKIEEALVVTERGRTQAFALQLARRQDNTIETPVTVPKISDIQRIAREQNATLVSYSLIFNQALYIWVVSPSGDIQFRSVAFNGTDAAINLIATIDGPVYRGDDTPSEVDQLVADTRAGIGVVGGLPPGRLQALHQVLIDPIADLLPTHPNDNVVFIPQGSLFLIPFVALQDAEGTYLIEKHTLTTAPSIQVLGLASEEVDSDLFSTTPNFLTPIKEQALVVGNPEMPTLPSIQLASLPGAEAEAIEIGALLNVAPLIGNQANEADIKQQLPTASLIHLATHGLFNYRDTPFDIPGAVALTPGRDEDGFLTASEILEMDLQAQLAILSACDTGRGEITGDGVVGLSRALITAGVPSVVVSLWAVPDSPTARLMTEFYRQLSQGQTKAQALRQAMLMVMEEHPEPRNWAAFTLIGANE